MRISVHDFGGYPYPYALSRALALRGHEVQHVYCGSHQTTPAGDLERAAGEIPALDIHGIRLKDPLDKFSFVKRWRQEREYGAMAVEETLRFQPDVVMSANMPLDAQQRLLRACRRESVPFVFWVQDLIGIAAHRILRKKLPVIGDVIGLYYVRMEKQQLRSSERVVVLTEDFLPLLESWGVDPHRMEAIHNWAPIEDFPLGSRDNAWSREQGIVSTRNFIYAGTLGLKHNPELLLRLARRFEDEPDVRVVVLSQGLGAEWLRERKQEERVDNLLILPYEPFKRMPDVMATADVLVAILEPDAGIFSVPSKVLAYLCGARPLLLAIPPENLAARIVARQEAGYVVSPDDIDGFLAWANDLLQDEALRARLGENARAYAEANFKIDGIAGRFEEVLKAAV